LHENTSYRLILVRHGETEWAKSGRHTGLTDIPLTENGRRQAALLGDILSKETFSAVYSSPLKRALDTCRLAGFQPTIDSNLVEWDYGQYEGLLRAEILAKDPSWNLFVDGGPEGESPEDVAKRADAFLSKPFRGSVLIFSSAHIFRVLAARWLKQPPLFGENFLLVPASISILGFEHGHPVIIRWNDICHLGYK